MVNLKFQADTTIRRPQVPVWVHRPAACKALVHHPSPWTPHNPQRRISVNFSMLQRLKRISPTWHWQVGSQESWRFDWQLITDDWIYPSMISQSSQIGNNGNCTKLRKWSRKRTGRTRAGRRWRKRRRRKLLQSSSKTITGVTNRCFMHT